MTDWTPDTESVDVPLQYRVRCYMRQMEGSGAKSGEDTSACGWANWFFKNEDQALKVARALTTLAELGAPLQSIDFAGRRVALTATEWEEHGI